MMPLFVLAAVVLIAVMFLAVKAHRHLVQSWLLHNGVRVPGQAVTVAPPMSAGLIRRLTSTVTIISYTARDGAVRSLMPRSGGATFTLAAVSGDVTVLYDAARPANEDRIRVGFGDDPATWHRVRVRPTS